MTKLRDILSRADEAALSEIAKQLPPPLKLEEEIAQQVQRAHPTRRDPLHPDAAELMSEAFMSAARKTATELQNVAINYLAEAQKFKEEVDAWAETLLKEAQRVAEIGASKHADFRNLAKGFRAVINGKEDDASTVHPSS